jgi:hypothetical protein
MTEAEEEVHLLRRSLLLQLACVLQPLEVVPDRAVRQMALQPTMEQTVQVATPRAPVAAQAAPPVVEDRAAAARAAAADLQATEEIQLRMSLSQVVYHL